MYLIGFPLLLIPFAIYNIIAFLFRIGFNDTRVHDPDVVEGDAQRTTSDILIIFSICCCSSKS